MKEILQVMNNDIKETEIFLDEYPVTNKITYKCAGEKTLIWNPTTKRIVLHTGSYERHLIEWDLGQRMVGYEYLPIFVDYCIKEQAKLIYLNETRIRQVSYNLSEVINKYITK